MGAICGCNGQSKDIIGFWKGIELRKITFEAYKRLYDTNQRKWLSSGESNRTVDIRKCDELYPLLNSSEFTEKQRTAYFDQLNNFINNQSDKLTFFTSLSFFTKINGEKDIKGDKNQEQKVMNLFDSMNFNGDSSKQKNLNDLIFESLLKMAIKRSDHDDVTRFFLELVTVFPLQFLHEEGKAMEEKLQIYSEANRERLFNQIKLMNNQKFYEYMFNRENVSLIHNDLIKIQMEFSSNDLIKVRTEANVNRETPTPN